MKHPAHLECGKINNFFGSDDTAKFVQIFKKITPHKSTGQENDCYGIDQNHITYPWFKKTILDPIAKEFNPDLKLIFGMLLDCTNPFPIHHDAGKEIPSNDPTGKSYLSFVIPYSVNNDPSLCHHASTIILDETDSLTDNLSTVHKEKISHVPIETTYQFKIKQELIWQPGDLLWWDTKMYHVSNNFLASGYTSKQGIVIHTYVL